MAALDPSFITDLDAKLHRDESYALDVAGDDATGGYYENDWFDFGQPDTVVQELVGILDRFTLHMELLSGRDAA